MEMEHFADRLIQQIQKKNSPVVAGLDPAWDKIPAFIREKYKSAGAAIFAFNKGLIDALYDVVPAVKPQLAYYEMYGITGLVAFQSTVDYARSKGLLVIADGKRNDIGSTSEAYAKAYLAPAPEQADPVSPLREGAFDADALTVNPYLGEDGIRPFTAACASYGKGIFALVKTSNRSSGQLQDLQLASGLTVYEQVAELVDEWGRNLIGTSGYSSVGAVVGATYPQQAESLRKRLPRALILVPGYGAQGGTADSVAVNFNQDGLGAVVNASRSIMYAYQSDKWSSRYGEEAFAEAARAEALAMSQAINQAVARKRG